jgi:hypothetical protein
VIQPLPGTTLNLKKVTIAAEMPWGRPKVISFGGLYGYAGSLEPASIRPQGDAIVENLDRFFEAYDRFLPSYFSEVAVAALLFGSVAFFAL